MLRAACAGASAVSAEGRGRVAWLASAVSMATTAYEAWPAGKRTEQLHGRSWTERGAADRRDREKRVEEEKSQGGGSEIKPNRLGVCQVRY